MKTWALVDSLAIRFHQIQLVIVRSYCSISLYICTDLHMGPVFVGVKLLFLLFVHMVKCKQ